MRNIILLFACFLISIKVYGQKKEITTIGFTSFSDNEWEWTNVSYSENTPYEVYIDSQEKLILNNPLKGEWGFTWIGIPKVFREINNFPNAEINFDLEIIETNQNGYFSLGLMFDTHNVSNQCYGGDFYNVNIFGNVSKNTISANIMQRKDCSYKTVSNPIIKSEKFSSFSNKINKVSIQKNSENYSVFINQVKVLSFEYAGQLNFSHLNFQKGKYSIDNLAINKIDYKTDLADTSIPTENSIRPNIFILIVGLKSYDNPNYLQTPLDFTINDTDALYKFWTSVNGGKINPENIIYLKESHASVDNILNNMASHFAKATENDAIITYFSGHGSYGFFAAHDGDLPYERLNSIISKARSKNKLFLVDACRSGSWEMENFLAPKGKRLSEEESLNLFYERLMSSGEGTNWLLSSKPDEFSADDSNLKHGAFTYYFLEGLKGEADKMNDENQIVTLSEIFTYLQIQFSGWNKRNEGLFYDKERRQPIKQSPVLKSLNGNLNMPIAVIPEM